jgi:GntR family transcriptional regulator
VNPTEDVAGRFPGVWKPNQASSVPLFEQLRLNIIERADNGTLAPGTRLPAVRNLAAELGVAPHTVARAYKELEAAGIVATRGRNGTVVCARDEAWSRRPLRTSRRRPGPKAPASRRPSSCLPPPTTGIDGPVTHPAAFAGLGHSGEYMFEEVFD